MLKMLELFAYMEISINFVQETLNNKEAQSMAQQITINGKIYTHKDVEITDYRDVVFNMLSQLKPMEYCRYYDKYILRNEQGQVCACYVDDLSNMFFI